MARILAISSHVVRGHVGLAATVPALQSLGHEVWALPTVLLASRPGLGRLSRHELPAAGSAAMLAALEADGCWPMLDAVFTGYFPSPAAVCVAADAIARMKAAKPSLLVLRRSHSWRCRPPVRRRLSGRRRPRRSATAWSLSPMWPRQTCSSWAG